MNKRTLSDEQDKCDTNKSGVKRYLMSSGNNYEIQKLNYERSYHSKSKSNSNSNSNSLVDILESKNHSEMNISDDSITSNGDIINDSGIISDINNNNVIKNNNIIFTGNNGNDIETNEIDNENDNEIDNEHGSITKTKRNNIKNNNGNSNNRNKNNNKNNKDNNNNNNDNNNGASSYKHYSTDCKKRKGRYSMPFLKKEKSNVNNILIIKNVPKEADEEDIKSFMRPFIKSKSPEINFCEEEITAKLYDDELSENIFNYFNDHPTQIKGSFVKVNLSKINDDNREDLESYENGSNNSNKIKGKSEKKNFKNNKNECSKVILVSIINLHYPVDIELIYYLFSKCGIVEKIITFSRNPIVYQALVQFQNIDIAKEAIKTLHNRNIYDGCNTIQIQYSFLKELVIKTNNSNSWDYTTTESKNKMIFNIANSHGVLPTPKRKTKDSELYHLIEKKFKLIDFETKNSSKTPVLICYNIPKDYTDVTKLFNLFSVYGFVSRIKILREKPDSALIQYSNYLYSSLAQECLQHAKICEQTLELHFSKIHDIRISPQQKKTESYKAKSFNNYDQRYIIADQIKYIKGACKPTKTLFISNVNDEVNEECIVDIFNRYGKINKIKFKHVKEGKKYLMVTIEVNSEDLATRALMDLHNHYLKDRAIKVSYTKTRLN